MSEGKNLRIMTTFKKPTLESSPPLGWQCSFARAWGPKRATEKGWNNSAARTLHV